MNTVTGKKFADQIIQLAAKNEAEKKEAAAHEVENRRKEIEEALRPAFTALDIDWLLEKGTFSVQVGDRHNNDMMTWYADSSVWKELELSAIVISVIPDRANPIEFRIWNTHSGGMKAYASLQETFVGARNRYADYKAHLISIEVEKVLDEAGYGLFNNHAAPKEAVTALRDKLVAVDPDQKEKYDRRLNDWLETVERIRVRDERVAREEKEREERKSEYLAACVEYVKQCVAIHEANGKIIADLQLELDKPVPLFQLEYGVVAESFDDEEYHKYAETRTVWVRDHGSKDNNFTHLDGTIVHYYNPIRIPVKPVMAIASVDNQDYVETHYLSAVPFLKGQKVFFIKGLTSFDDVWSKLKERGLQQYPDKPQTELDYYAAEFIFNQAVSSVMRTDDLPY